MFCKPATASARDIPVNKLNCLRILEAIAPENFSLPEVETLLKNDRSLIYKLLRYLISPLLGLRSEVHGVRDAIALLGETEFRRWISIVTMAGDKPPELIRTALTRAFFCIGIPAQGPDLFLIFATSTSPCEDRRKREGWRGSDRWGAYERADWPAVAGAAARLAQTESAISDCYQFAATRAAALPF